jgi:hemerythrin-like metal-binding protein
MDNEHIILIEKMNALYDGHQEEKSMAELDLLVQDFVAYTKEHFQSEEIYMEKVQFEGLETHKIIHKQLLSQVTEHVEEFKRTGELSQKFFNLLSTWPTSHIRGIDVKYGNFVNKAS